jgi:hypothetical protein
VPTQKVIRLWLEVSANHLSFPPQFISPFSAQHRTFMRETQHNYSVYSAREALTGVLRYTTFTYCMEHEQSLHAEDLCIFLWLRVQYGQFRVVYVLILLKSSRADILCFASLFLPPLYRMRIFVLFFIQLHMQCNLTVQQNVEFFTVQYCTASQQQNFIVKTPVLNHTHF